MKLSRIFLILLLMACLAVFAYKPDRPDATIVPGSSSGPAFVVQIIRPRFGLPMGGILPPQIFGLEGHLRMVRCRPAKPTVGTIYTTSLTDTGEISGAFDIELARCEDANTGTSLGWPPKPFVLHGSFDRLPKMTRSLDSP